MSKIDEIVKTCGEVARDAELSPQFRKELGENRIVTFQCKSCRAAFVKAAHDYEVYQYGHFWDYGCRRFYHKFALVTECPACHRTLVAPLESTADLI